MSYKEEHVKLNEEDLEGHDEPDMRKHLTMKYNMKELRKLAEFEQWVLESLEDLVPDDSKRPVVEASQFRGYSDEKIVTKLQKALRSAIPDEETRDDFIEQYITRFRKLPENILESL